MDPKALYSLSYGVFMVATKFEGKTNGCITNTCIQVASNPTRIGICCINGNYTTELIKKSGIFSVSVLDKTCPFDTIKHFGMQSGRDVDKMSGLNLPLDVNGVPTMGWGACSVISAHVVDSFDLGSHTMFIAEIDDAVKITDNEPLTYAYYQSDVKPKPAVKNEEKKIKGWRCKICGYVVNGEKLPADFICPLCGHDASDFEPVYD